MSKLKKIEYKRKLDTFYEKVVKIELAEKKKQIIKELKNNINNK